MSINIDDLTPEQAATLLAQLNERDRQNTAEQRADEEIDRTLRAALAERAVSVGCPWEDPDGRASRAYPMGWVVQHHGHWWQAARHVVMSEPTPGNPDWEINDPEPAPETPANTEKSI